MAARTPTAPRAADADLILDTRDDATLLDVLDKLLNKGVVLDGDVVLGVAGVDLVYLRLSSLLCAIDRIMPDAATAPPGRRRKRRHNRAAPKLRRRE